MCSKDLKNRAKYQFPSPTKSYLFVTEENFCSARFHNNVVPVRIFIIEKRISDYSLLLSGWPSGLRRCVQVAVYSCRRGFESHFWHYFMPCKCSIFFWFCCRSYFSLFLICSMSVLLLKTMAERRREKCLTHPVCYFLMNIKWLVSLFFLGFMCYRFSVSALRVCFLVLISQKKNRATFLANHR